MAPPPSKRRKVARPTPVEEVTFDLDARHDYLTGFHKRKLQRAKHAQEIAERKAKEEKREQRRKMREERQVEFQKALEEHQRQMRELNASTDQESGADDGDEDGEWGGVAEPPPADYEAEYIDEDKYTTVTVEEIDISKGRDGFMSDRDESSDEEKRDPSGRRIKENGTTTKAADKTKETKSTRTKGTTNGVKKKKKKKFTYETKAERKVGQMKVKARKKQMAQARRGKE